MKPVVRYIIAASAVTACLFLWLVGDRVGAENRREVTCNSVDAIIADSLAFISPDDIKDWMADYGTYLGLRLDSVDLKKVEAVIDGKSAVRKSQAWLTDDGVLHIRPSARARPGSPTTASCISVSPSVRRWSASRALPAASMPMRRASCSRFSCATPPASRSWTAPCP